MNEQGRGEYKWIGMKGWRFDILFWKGAANLRQCFPKWVHNVYSPWSISLERWGTIETNAAGISHVWRGDWEKSEGARKWFIRKVHCTLMEASVDASSESFRWWTKHTRDTGERRYDCIWCDLMVQDHSNTWSTVGDRRSLRSQNSFHRVNSGPELNSRRGLFWCSGADGADIRYTLEELLSIYQPQPIAPDLVGRPNVE